MLAQSKKNEEDEKLDQSSSLNQEGTLSGKFVDAVDTFLQVIIVVNTIIHFLCVSVYVRPCVRRCTNRWCVVVLSSEQISMHKQEIKNILAVVAL